MRRFCALAWAAWYCRNKVVFEQEEPNAVRVGCSFVKLVTDYREYAAKVFNPTFSPNSLVSSGGGMGKN